MTSVDIVMPSRVKVFRRLTNESCAGSLAESFSELTIIAVLASKPFGCTVRVSATIREELFFAIARAQLAFALLKIV